MRGLVVPEKTEDFTADPVELFFDLAFVFAFSQLVAHLVHHPTWRGAAEGSLLFLVLWFAWSTFTWSANAVSGNAREVRALFLVATATSVPMGASVTRAFDTGGPTFAICASVIILMALGLQLWGHPVGSEQFNSVVRYAWPNVLGMVLLIAGGFVDGSARTVLWIGFLLVIFGSQVAAGSSDWIVRIGHFAERHGLIVIIALGEVVVAIGIPVVESLSEQATLPTETLVGLVAAGVMAGLLWWAYFDRALPALEYRGKSLEGRERGQYARDVYTWIHVPIVAGIIATAAATEEILLHPGDSVPAEFRVMFVAGLALFLGGVAIAVFRAFRAIAKERMAAMVAIAVLALIGGSVDGVALLLAIDAVLAVGLLAEHLRVEQLARAG